MPHENIVNAINESNCGLNTSISEGMCNFILECMALNTAVISRDNDGNRFLHEGKVKRTGKEGGVSKEKRESNHAQCSKLVIHK